MPVADSSLATDLRNEKLPDSNNIPRTMLAAVYRGEGRVAPEEVATPSITDDEVLIRVEACGICHTDLKKIQHNLLAPPRIYGHETAGVVAQCGAKVHQYRPGDRVIVFHHVPCGDCFYCARRLYAQCPEYKREGSRLDSSQPAADLRNTRAS